MQIELKKTNIHFSSKSDDWATPQDFFIKYDKIYNFGLDAAASSENAKCAKYFSVVDDGLNQSWGGYGAVWCNPPYSQLKKWIQKAYKESLLGVIVVMLIPARTDTAAWHDYIFPYAEIEFIRGRLKFGNSKNSAPFPSAIVIFGKKQAQAAQIKD